MTKENVVTRENFDSLLEWLDRNREIAAQKYEKIRGRLIRIFAGRGCFEAEELADETFNRVTGKLPQLAENYTGDPSLYFYGVANKLHLEWLRKQQKKEQARPSEIEAEENEEDRRAVEYDCLEMCLENLPAAQRQMIVEYYREEKNLKIENRRELAKTLGITSNALQVKAARLRSRLKICVQKCAAEKK